jgi:DNA-binding transcriptional LysR family regulator
VPPHGLAQEHLLDDEFVVTASARHRLAGKKRLTLADVADERWAMAAANTVPWQRLLQVFDKQGLAPPRVAMLSNSALIRLQTVAESSLLNLSSLRFLRQSGLRNRVVILPIRELAWTRRIGTHYRSDGYLSPAARRFIDLLKTRARTIASEFE